MKNKKTVKVDMISKTSDATCYKIKLGEVSLFIVDTPGFGDTRGSKKDEEHSSKIKEKILELNGVNCIMII